MDRNIDVRTPESIALRYELAGLGSRFLAVAIDLAIQIGLLLLLVWGLSAAVSHGASAPKALAGSAEDRFIASVAIAILIFIVFAIFYGYYIVFEAFWNGQTPGKKLLGIRVVRDGGYPLDFGGSFLRNLIRIGEQLLGFYLLAAISALVSPENKRIGDYAAGTIVVRDGTMAAPLALSEALEHSTQTRSGAYLDDDERALIARFLERRATLDRSRRLELSGQLAARFRDRAPASLRTLGDEDLLERL